MSSAMATSNGHGDNHPLADGATTEPHRAVLLHTAPSVPDMLALKRQRVKSLQGIAGQGESDVQPKVHPQPVPGDNVAGTAQQTLDLGSAACALLPGIAEPLLQGMLGEPMSTYFSRLRAAAGSGSCKVSRSMEQDGVYVHKRPIRGPNSVSPLAVCGSVLHHVVVYVKQGPLLHSLDYGPANGADVTANILEEAPAKRVLATMPAPTAPAVIGPDGADDTGTGNGERVASSAADAEELPYLFLGPASRDVDDVLVQQLIAFAESRPYHALRNNCVHFADALVRTLTAGAVRGGPLLFDLHCGTVPPVDNPMLLMLQLMLRMSWFMVVDGSPLMAAFLEHVQAGQPQQTPAAKASPAMSMTLTAAAAAVANAPEGDARACSASVAAAAAVAPPAGESEDTDNNVTAASAPEAESGVATEVPSAGLVAVERTPSAADAGGCSGPGQGQVSDAAAAVLAGAPRSVGGGDMAEAEGGRGVDQPSQEEECRQEHENDLALCEATTGAGPGFS